MRLFKKKQRDINTEQEELAAGIAGKIINWQRKAADHLNYKAANLSPKTRLFLLILFCMLFAAVNIYLLIQSF